MYTVEFLIGQDWYRMESVFDLSEAQELAKEISSSKDVKDHGYGGTLFLGTENTRYKTTYDSYIGKNYIKLVRLVEVKKPMTINTNSWHYKLFHLFWDKDPQTHCGYFWKGLITSGFIVFIISVVSSMLYFIGTGILTKLGIVLGGTIITGIAAFFAGLVLGALVALVLFGGAAILVGVIKGIGFLVERYNRKQIDKALEEYDVKVEHDEQPEIKLYKSFKNKHCALVKYE